MAITKNKKVEILKRLKEEAMKAKTIVFVNFHGLSVTEATNLRRSLTESATKFFVAKKTLIKKALTEADFRGEPPALDGELAVAYGDDQLAVPKSVYEYEKKTAGLVKILGGVLDGAYADQHTVVSLAEIPPRDVLYGQLVNIINSPIAGLVMALEAIAKQREV